MKGFRFYNKDDEVMKHYGDYASISFTEQPKKQNKWNSSAEDVAKVQWDHKNEYILILGKSGSARISTSFVSSAGYKYKLSKQVYVLNKTAKEAQNELLQNADEYFVKWKTEHKVSYSEEEVCQKLQKILTNYPDGEKYTNSKYYKKEWLMYDMFLGEIIGIIEFSPSEFSYIFASKINCELFGTDQCIIEQNIADEFVYNTVKMDYRWLLYPEGYCFGENYSFYPYFAKGCANGCEEFAKGMTHFKDDYDRARIGDIIITNLGYSPTRAGVIISKSDTELKVIYSDKITHYADWSRAELEEDEFMIITRYE